MESKDYQVESQKTIPQFGLCKESPLIVVALGLTGESGEIAEIVKKVFAQGHPYNDDVRRHLLNELGDLFWYLNLACTTLGVSFEDVWQLNVEKLRRRYPGGVFTPYESINREGR